MNVWLALAIEQHSSGLSAREWAREARLDWLVLSRVTQMGGLRLLTNPAAMGRDVFTGTAAWRVIDRFMEHENIRFVPEPEGLEETWRGLTRTRSGANFWTDAYLAAFARTSGFTLVTFDRGFASYRDIPVRILAAQPSS